MTEPVDDPAAQMLPGETVEQFAARTSAERDAAREAEWGAYVANGPIYVGGALAFNEGQPVPASSVERHKYLEMNQVRRAGDPAPEPEQPAATPVGDPLVLNPEPAAVSDPEPAAADDNEKD